MTKLEDDSKPWPEVTFESKRRGPTDEQVLWEIASKLEEQAKRGPDHVCALSDLSFDREALLASLTRLAADGLVRWKDGDAGVEITPPGRLRVAEIAEAGLAVNQGDAGSEG